MDWIDTVQDRDQSWTLVNTVITFRVAQTLETSGEAELLLICQEKLGYCS
jgi:hypothetical protein